MKKLLIIISLGFAVAGGAACAHSWDANSPEPATWAEPADYTYRVAHGVFGPGMGTYDITVSDHAAIAIVEVPKSDGAIEQGWMNVDRAWTLADLEAKYFEAKANPESDATITYDPVTGAPSEIHLDWIVDAVDDEESFKVLAFEPGR